MRQNGPQKPTSDDLPFKRSTNRRKIPLNQRRSSERRKIFFCFFPYQRISFSWKNRIFNFLFASAPCVPTTIRRFFPVFLLFTADSLDFFLRDTIYQDKRRKWNEFPRSQRHLAMKNRRTSSEENFWFAAGSGNVSMVIWLTWNVFDEQRNWRNFVIVLLGGGKLMRKFNGESNSGLIEDEKCQENLKRASGEDSKGGKCDRMRMKAIK